MGESIFNINYQNVRGLNTKTNMFFNAVSLTQHEYDAVALTETWLTTDVFDSELFPANFLVYRNRNRPDQIRGGGVLLAVKNVYKSDIILLDFTDPAIDLLIVKVYTSNISYIYIIVLYISPSCSILAKESVFSYLECLDFLYESDFIIIGDFNIPRLAEYYHNDKERDVHVDLLLNFLEFFDCKQHNYVSNNNNRILDLVISRLQCNVTQNSTDLVDEDLHHPSLIIEAQLKSQKQKTLIINKISNFNFRRADYLTMYQLFQGTRWNELESLTDVNDAVRFFYDKIYEIFRVCVPKSNRKRQYPVWFTKEIIKNIKKKEKLRLKAKKSGIVETKRKFVTLRAKLKRDIKRAYNVYINRIQLQISGDSRAFWQYIKNKKGNISTPSKMYLNQSHYADGKTIANAFATFFSSVYDSSNTMIVKCAEKDYLTQVVSLNVIADHDVRDAVRSLKVNKSVGPDNIPSYIIKGMVDCLLQPLTFLFNLSLKTGTFPDEWKKVKICPIFKKGEKADITNYRPVAILSNVAKIFESIVYKHIYNSVIQKISRFQHGFMKNRSTVSNLSNITQYISESLDNKCQVDVIYTDFAKAFDRISHQVLLCKLDNEFGFHPTLVQFFTSYLQGRKQRVVIGGYTSDSYTATSGIPQGSNLGPLLFLLFVNDLPNKIKESKILLFADDLKLYSVVKNVADCEKLQRDINEVLQWSEINNLKFNITKCYSVSYSRKKNPLHYDYNMNNVVLARVEEIQDLGVTFDSRLSFKTHILNITKKASRMYGFIVRNCRQFTKLDCIRLLFISYVRCILEYANIIWSPCYDTHKLAIERVQSRFLRYLYYKETGVYDLSVPKTELMSRYKLVSLEKRRNIASVIYLHKLLHNKIDDVNLLQQINFNVPSYRTRNALTFYLNNSRTNHCSNAPINVMCRLANAIQSRFDIFYSTQKQIRATLHEVL